MVVTRYPLPVDTAVVGLEKRAPVAWHEQSEILIQKLHFTNLTANAFSVLPAHLPIAPSVDCLCDAKEARPLGVIIPPDSYPPSSGADERNGAGWKPTMIRPRVAANGPSYSGVTCHVVLYRAVTLFNRHPPLSFRR